MERWASKSPSPITKGLVLDEAFCCTLGIEPVCNSRLITGRQNRLHHAAHATHAAHTTHATRHTTH